MFVIAALVVLCISHWNASRQLSIAQQEIKALRKETGHLHDYDPNKIAVVAVPIQEDLTWKW